MNGWEKDQMASITKRGNTYRIRISLGYDMVGNQIVKSTTFTPPAGVTEGKARKLAQEFASEYERKCRGQVSLRENMRLSEMCSWYLDNYATNELKEISAYNYNAAIQNHILPALGNCKLKDLSPAMLTRFYKDLCQKPEGAISPSSVKKIHTVLSSILSFGVKQGFILQNPCQRATLPKIKKEERPFLNDNQLRQLLEMLEEYSVFSTAIKLLIYTGIRSGECLGLQWDDIDFDSGVLSVRHTLTYAFKHWSLTEPKTQNSVRSLKLAKEAVDLLKLHRAKQVEQRLKIGSMWKYPNMVFTTSTGNYYDRSLLNTQFKKIIAGTDLEGVTLHSLRHSNATLLINSGIPLKVVSQHLGHSSIEVTADIYSHVLESSRAKVADTLELKLK